MPEDIQDIIMAAAAVLGLSDYCERQVAHYRLMEEANLYNITTEESKYNLQQLTIWTERQKKFKLMLKDQLAKLSEAGVID